MCGHKTRRIAAGMNIPCGANIQDGAVGRYQRTVNGVTCAVPRLLRLDYLTLAGVPEQSLGQPIPLGNGEAEAQEKGRLAPARRVRRVE